MTSKFSPKGMMHEDLRRFMFLLALLWGSHFASAQGTTATLGGKVSDSQERIIPGAIVTVTAEDTGVQQKVVTNQQGEWRAESLVPGHYHFQVTSSGFKKALRSNIELQVADQKFIDVNLPNGDVTEEVTVDSTLPLIDTSSAVSGTVITSAELDELPSQTNVATQLAALSPGIWFAGANTGGQIHLWSNVAASGITANFAGSGTSSVSYLIEGATNTNAAGQEAFVPPMTAIQQFRVITNAYDSSIDRAAGGVIDMSLRPGTRDFHGMVYERNQNNTFNARDYENTGTSAPVPPVHVNEWGLGVGGPVWFPRIFDGRKKGTFFYFSYDGIRNKAPANTGYMSIPTLLERQGDFSKSFSTSTANGVTTPYPTQVYDPLTIDTTTGSRQLFQNEKISPARISPIAAAIFALMPPPDNAGDGSSSDSNNYIKREVQNDKFASFTFRLDNAWSNNQHSFAELRYNNWSETSFDPFGAANILNGTLQTRSNFGLTLNHSTVLSPSFLINFLGNLTSYRNTSKATSAGVDPTKFGFTQNLAVLQQLRSLPLIVGVGSGEENGGFGTNEGGSYDNDILYEGKVEATQTAGNHAIKYGVHFIGQQQATGDLSTTGGSFTFGNNWTIQNPNTTAGIGVGSNTASFLLGLPTSGSIPTSATAFWSQPFLGAYAQDDWRATSRLTLNLGLRWDAQFALTERFDRFFSRFDPDVNILPVTGYAQPNYATLIAGTSTNIGVKVLQQYRPDVNSFVARGGIRYAGIQGTSRDVTDPIYDYIQPRIGFAYRFTDKTVLGGGIGRFVEATFVTSHANQLGFSQSTPFVATQDNYYTPAATLDNPFPSGKVPTTGNENGELTSVGSVTSFATPRVPRQYNDEASLHLQQQIGNFLLQIAGTLEMTHDLNVNYSINNVSLPAWHAAYDAEFDSTGKPVDPLPGDMQVTNPFYGAPDITTTTATSKTIAAYQLLRPNPMLGDLQETFYNGSRDFYSLQQRIERRYAKGFGIIQSFTWGKSMQANSYLTPAVVSEKLHRQISSTDQRFAFTVSPTYVLPFGHNGVIGRNVNGLVDRFISGWTFTGIYTFNSGTPVVLPTNSSFFAGGDPGSGFKKTRQQQFNTSLFYPFPSVNTPRTGPTGITSYPGWTGITNLPGYNWQPTSATGAQNGVYQDFHTWATNNSTTFGNVRNPPLDNFDLGVRKSIPTWHGENFELRIDAFNAFNHPRFGNVGTSPSGAYFGHLNNTALLSQINSPRTIQLEGRYTF